MRWGEDDPDACQLHPSVYNMLERHIMGITAAQFVWDPEGEVNDTANTGAASSGGEPPQNPTVEGSESEATTTKKRVRQKSTQSEDHETD